MFLSYSTTLSEFIYVSVERCLAFVYFTECLEV